jgi:hypothetical protein
MDKLKIALIIGFLFLLSVAYAEQETQRVIQDIFFDKNTKTISYSLNYPAYIRIRVGVEDGPMYQTLINWQEKKSGKHSETFTGLDNEKTAFTLHYFTEGDEDRYGLDLSEILPNPAQAAIGKTLPIAHLNQLHKEHSREICSDPQVQIKFSQAKVENGAFVINKETPLIIELDKKDRAWFLRERFQVHIFLDNVLVHADLEGYVPYVWNFNPKGINPGKHRLTVNLNGFNDHIGAATLPIVVKKS